MTSSIHTAKNTHLSSINGADFEENVALVISSILMQIFAVPLLIIIFTVVVKLYLHCYKNNEYEFVEIAGGQSKSIEIQTINGSQSDSEFIEPDVKQIQLSQLLSIRPDTEDIITADLIDTKEINHLQTKLNILYKWTRKIHIECILGSNGIQRYDATQILLIIGFIKNTFYDYDYDMNVINQISKYASIVVDKYEINIHSGDNNPYITIYENTIHNNHIAFAMFDLNDRPGSVQPFWIRARAILIDGTICKYSNWIATKTSAKSTDKYIGFQSFADYDDALNDFWNDHMNINANDTLNLEQWLSVWMKMNITLSEYELKRIFYYIVTNQTKILNTNNRMLILGCTGRTVYECYGFAGFARVGFDHFGNKNYFECDVWRDFQQVIMDYVYLKKHLRNYKMCC